MRRAIGTLMAPSASRRSRLRLPHKTTTARRRLQPTRPRPDPMHPRHSRHRLQWSTRRAQQSGAHSNVESNSNVERLHHATPDWCCQRSRTTRAATTRTLLASPAALARTITTTSKVEPASNVESSSNVEPIVRSVTAAETQALPTAPPDRSPSRSSEPYLPRNTRTLAAASNLVPASNLEWPFGTVCFV